MYKEGIKMNSKILYTPCLLISILLASCSVLSTVGVKVITPSKTIISENREASGFTAINFSTFGKVNIIQGDKESLNISGPDNLVPEISTAVVNGTLAIKNKENFTVTSLASEYTLTFTIVVKDLASLVVSGLGDVQVETLSTPSMDLEMSGAGKIQLNQLTTESLKVNLSGLGGVEMSGSATQATIDLSGAGSISAPDLKIQTANINVSGLGGATLWVTSQLDGNISGAGSVSYYGLPNTNLTTTGLGKFNSLGRK
jgi:hypothetical protein